MIKIPVKYSLRSLMQRPLRSLLTVTGVGLSVFLSVMMLGLSRGLMKSTLASGEELNVIALSKGAEALEFSAIDPTALNILASSMGVAQAGGQPMARPEAYVNSLVKLAGDDGPPQPVLVRGILDEAGYALHPQVGLLAGVWPQRGYQAAVGQLVATRLGLEPGDLQPGMHLEFEGEHWEITGLLDATGTVFEAEIWTQIDDLMVASRHDDYSAVLLRARDQAALGDLLYDLETRTDARSTPIVERDYYTDTAAQIKPVQVVTYVMSLLLISGGLMAGMNTMFNSILGRAREMAVLLVMGYRRAGVLLGFILESVLLCLAGGAVGCLAGSLLNGLPMNFTMGAFRFQVDAGVLAVGLGLAASIGLLGAVVPVLRVAGMKTVAGLRQ